MPCAFTVWVLYARSLGCNGSFCSFSFKLLFGKQERTCGYIRRIGIAVSTIHKDCIRTDDMEHRRCDCCDIAFGFNFQEKRKRIRLWDAAWQEYVSILPYHASSDGCCATLTLKKLTHGIPAFGMDCSLSPTSSGAGLAMLCTKQTIIPTLTTYGGGRLP